MSFMPIEHISVFTLYAVIKALLIIDSWTRFKHSRNIFWGWWKYNIMCSTIRAAECLPTMS